MNITGIVNYNITELYTFQAAADKDFTIFKILTGGAFPADINSFRSACCTCHQIRNIKAVFISRIRQINGHPLLVVYFIKAELGRNNFSSANSYFIIGSPAPVFAAIVGICPIHCPPHRIPCCSVDVQINPRKIKFAIGIKSQYGGRHLQ